MPEWLQIFLAVGGSALIGLVVADIYKAIKKNSAKYREAQKRERQESYREVLKQELEPVKEDVAELKKDMQDTKSGIQAELRHDIRNASRRCIKQGYKTTDDLEEVTSMHIQYENLGSNGITNALYDEFLKLPTRPNDHERKRMSANRKKAPLKEESK